MKDFVGKVSKFGPERLIIEIPATYREYYKPGEKVMVCQIKGASTRGKKK